jgi:hypothetical protein
MVAPTTIDIARDLEDRRHRLMMRGVVLDDRRAPLVYEVLVK